MCRPISKELGVTVFHVILFLYFAACIGYCTWSLYVWGFTELLDFLLKHPIP